MHEIAVRDILRRHFHRLGDEFEPRVGYVAQLSAHLHHHIDSGPSQLPGRYEAQCGDASLAVAHRLHAEHPQRLRHGSPLCGDELARPQRVAHLSGPLMMLAAVPAQRVLRQALAVFPCLRVGRIVGVDTEHVPPCGQHIRIARGRRHIAATEGTNHSVALILCRLHQEPPVFIGSHARPDLLPCFRQVVMRYIGVVLLLTGGDAPLLAVGPCQLEGQRFRLHGHHRLEEVLLRVGHAHGVVSPLHALIGQFLEVCVDTLHLLGAVRPGQCAVELQVAVQSLPHHLAFDAQQ